MNCLCCNYVQTGVGGFRFFFQLKDLFHLLEDKQRKLSVKTFLMAFEASHGAVAQSVTVKTTGCGFDYHSRR